MFRGQVNPFDDVIAKATDENLTSENWEYIMEAVDKVQEGGETGPRDVVAALIKRLAHRNAQVQIYTLETGNALSQNCGVPIHRELSSRSFTDALLRLANDRNTHQAVKSKVLERMENWVEMFSKDAELGIMEQAYMRLKSQNPTLHAPSKPVKSAITEVDRQREDDDLARALEISLQDSRKQNSSGGPSTSQAAQTQKQPEPKPAEPLRSTPVPTPAAISNINSGTAATVSRVRALYDFEPTETGELAFRKGDVIAVLESVYKDWWKGSLRGQTGIFPLNYVEKLADPSPEEMQREAQTEAEIFAQIKNVEKLLSMLSTSSADKSVQDNEEITTLYHQTLAIRPKLIDLISKYQQKRDDFVALNEKFVKARRDYEALLDTSMSHPPQPNYPQPYSYGGPYGAPPPAASTGGPPGQFYPPGGTNSSQPGNAGAYGAPPPHDSSQHQTAPYPTVPPQGGPAGGAYYPGANAPQGGRNPSPSGAGGLQRLSSHEGQQPQELATSSYDSPTDTRNSYHDTAAGQQQQPSQPPPQGQGQGGQSQAAYQSYYTKYQQQQYPSQPGGGAPPPQGNPVITATSPTTHRSSVDTYQEYLNNRPTSWHDPNVSGGNEAQHGGGAGGGAGADPASYYTNRPQNNELFLPQGHT